MEGGGEAEMDRSKDNGAKSERLVDEMEREDDN
jgi:hypothetical protein